MASFNFLKNYAKTSAQRASDASVSLLAVIDPEGLTETAIKQSQDEHAEAVKQLTVAQADFKREKQEFEEVQKLFNQKLAGAERAQVALTLDPTNTVASDAVIELLADVEKLAPKLEKERADYERAERFVVELQQYSNEIAGKLIQLRDQLNEVNAQAAEAALDLARNEKRKKQAETLAGLRTSSNKFDVALGALKKQADEKQAEAATAATIADQLTIPVKTISSAAASFLEDDTSAVTESVTDRLARLKELQR